MLFLLFVTLVLCTTTTTTTITKSDELMRFYEEASKYDGKTRIVDYTRSEFKKFCGIPVDIFLSMSHPYCINSNGEPKTILMNLLLEEGGENCEFKEIIHCRSVD
jgi:hypothetical protein